MPITRSAKKAQRQNLRRKIRNLAKKRAVSDAKKKLRAAIAAKNTEEAKEILRALYKAVDKAVKTGAVKKGAGKRVKSRFAKKVQR
jgi:small subunit ribosomal protein S20